MEKHKIVFNQNLEDIAQKLHFSMVDRKDTYEDVIYSEESIRGVYQIRPNTDNEDSKVDIELLFNAILTQPARMTNIFKK